jgi:hypothetical protein
MALPVSVYVVDPRCVNLGTFSNDLFPAVMI